MRIRKVIVSALVALGMAGSILSGTVAATAVPASASVTASVPQTWMHT